MGIGLGFFWGNWVSRVQAELRAFKDSLLLTIDLGISYLDIEMDSLVVVELVNSNTTSNIFFSAIVGECRCLLNKFDRFTLKHIFREACCVNILTKTSCA
jgi:hypothetical protein